MLGYRSLKSIYFSIFTIIVILYISFTCSADSGDSNHTTILSNVPTESDNYAKPVEIWKFSDSDLSPAPFLQNSSNFFSCQSSFDLTPDQYMSKGSTIQASFQGLRIPLPNASQSEPNPQLPGFIALYYRLTPKQFHTPRQYSLYHTLQRRKLGVMTLSDIIPIANPSNEDDKFRVRSDSVLVDLHRYLHLISGSNDDYLKHYVLTVTAVLLWYKEPIYQYNNKATSSDGDEILAGPLQCKIKYNHVKYDPLLVNGSQNRRISKQDETRSISLPLNPGTRLPRESHRPPLDRHPSYNPNPPASRRNEENPSIPSSLYPRYNTPVRIQNDRKNATIIPVTDTHILNTTLAVGHEYANEMLTQNDNIVDVVIQRPDYDHFSHIVLEFPLGIGGFTTKSKSETATFNCQVIYSWITGTGHTQHRDQVMVTRQAHLEPSRITIDLDYSFHDSPYLDGIQIRCPDIKYEYAHPWVFADLRGHISNDNNQNSDSDDDGATTLMLSSNDEKKTNEDKDGDNDIKFPYPFYGPQKSIVKLLNSNGISLYPGFFHRQGSQGGNKSPASMHRTTDIYALHIYDDDKQIATRMVSFSPTMALSSTDWFAIGIAILIGIIIVFLIAAALAKSYLPSCQDEKETKPSEREVLVNGQLTVVKGGDPIDPAPLTSSSSNDQMIIPGDGHNRQGLRPGKDKNNHFEESKYHDNDIGSLRSPIGSHQNQHNRIDNSLGPHYVSSSFNRDQRSNTTTLGPQRRHSRSQSLVEMASSATSSSPQDRNEHHHAIGNLVGASSGVLESESMDVTSPGVKGVRWKDEIGTDSQIDERFSRPTSASGSLPLSNVPPLEVNSFNSSSPIQQPDRTQLKSSLRKPQSPKLP